MVEEAVERKLYDAATKGDVATLQQLLQQDPYLVDEISYARSRNLLHIATIHMQADIVEEVLKTNPELARDLDSKMSSSLHIAAAKGSLEIAKKLLSVAPEACWWRDCNDMNPVHIAAMSGHVDILKELLRSDFSPAKERLHRGQTVLHLCVKHHQIKAFEFLALELGELVCAQDDDRETLMHMAVTSNQIENMRYLVKSYQIEKLTKNSLGKTPLDVLNENSRDPTTYQEFERNLRPLSGRGIEIFLPEMTEITMVVGTLIATMAFQAAVSPPGGVWQDDTSSHKAGRAVMATTHAKIYKHFVRANTTAFITSLITIFLVTTRMPSENPIFMVIAMYAMWVSLVSISVSYGASLMLENGGSCGYLGCGG